MRNFFDYFRNIFILTHTIPVLLPQSQKDREISSKCMMEEGGTNGESLLCSKINYNQNLLLFEVICKHVDVDNSALISDWDYSCDFIE